MTMTSHTPYTDTADLRRQARFLEEVEMAIRAANQKIIGEHIPEMGRESFFRLALEVAKLRAAYLDAVLQIDWNDPDHHAVDALRRSRETFEEAKAGFEALRHCIEVGYVAIGEDGRKAAPETPVKTGAPL